MFLVSHYRGPALFLSFSSLLIACGGDSGGATQAVASSLPAAPAPVVLAGRFNPLAGYEAGVSGRALLVRGPTETRVSVQVNGLVAGTTYPAHVHEWPCSAQSGGAHYKIDPAVAGTVEENEIWPVVGVGESGSGRAEVVVPHVARGDALSVVVHDPLADGAKLACADLTLTEGSEFAGSGEFAAFAAAVGSDLEIAGSASLSRSATGTSVQLRVSGLSPREQYRAHVHQLPCGVMGGGGHYKFDPSVEGALAENELWPSVVPDEAGAVDSAITSSHLARLDAQSVVIHRVAGDTAPKVACADLTAPQLPSLAATSSAVLFYAAAVERQLTGLAAGALMVRSPSGSTEVSLRVAGLAPNSEYPVHVHAQPCGVGEAGGHYKLDPGVAEAIEANELWLPLSSNAAGEAERTASVQDHVVRAEAQSIVVHDGVDGAKLVCIDLD